LHRELVDEIPGFEVIGTIQHQLYAIEHFGDIPRSQVGSDRLRLAFAVDPAEMMSCCFNFRPGALSVFMIIEPLPLQIIQFDVVTVDQNQTPNACAEKRRSVKAPESPTTDDRDACIEEPLLPGKADSRKANLTRISISVLVLHQLIPTRCSGLLP
jgi:hypothetical protein